MKHALVLCAIFFCSAFIAHAQVLPTSDGSCSISAKGVMGCEWLSTPPLKKKADGTLDWRPQRGQPQLFVTKFTVSPGALLHRMAQGQDVLIIGMGDGEFVNETKSPPIHVDVSNGSVFLMAKEEPYSLRNVGKQDLMVLVVLTRR